MSAIDIGNSEACADLSCPYDGGGLPPGCVIPFNGTTEEFCRSVQINAIIQLLVILSVVLAMIGIGAAMDPSLIRKAAGNPKPVLVGLFCQVIVKTLFMFALIAAFGDLISDATKLSAVLIAAAPGGTGSNVLAWLAKGSVELSVVMTIASTLFAFASMPFFAWAAVEIFFREGDSLTVDFVSIFTSALLSSVFPLVGLAIKVYLPRGVSAAVAKYAGGLGIAGVIASFFGYIADPLFRASIVESGWPLWIVAIALNLVGLFVGYVGSRIAKLKPSYCRTITFEVGCQNATIVLAIISVSFDAGPTETLFTPFVITNTLMALCTSYVLMLFWRFVWPLEEEEIDDLGQSGGLTTKSITVDSENALALAASIGTDSKLAGSPGNPELGNKKKVENPKAAVSLAVETESVPQSFDDAAQADLDLSQV